MTHNLDLWWVTPGSWAHISARSRAPSPGERGPHRGLNSPLRRPLSAATVSLFTKFATKCKISISLSFCISPVHFCIAEHVCCQITLAEKVSTTELNSQQPATGIVSSQRHFIFGRSNSREGSRQVYTCALLFQIALRWAPTWRRPTINWSWLSAPICAQVCQSSCSSCWPSF